MIKRTTMTVAMAALASLAMLGADHPQTPHLTNKTYFAPRQVNNLMAIGDPSDGIFSLAEENRELGWSDYFSFWTIDGRYLFAPEWEQPQSSEIPRFDSGACMVMSGKKDKDYNQPLCILYADGSVKELPLSWKEATQFFDGVAKVKTKDQRVFYINTEGVEIWPELGCKYVFAKGAPRMNMNIKDNMHYVREGLRAYFDNSKDRWGFLDEKGKVMIPAKFVEVRDFHSGYALAIIKPESGSNYAAFIDKKGNEVVKLPVQAPTLQYAENISDVDAGHFSIDHKYYDLTGKEVDGASGTPFYGGFAFRKNGYDEPYTVIDSKFIPLRRLYSKGADLERYNAMQYSDIGVVTADKRYVYKADGELLLAGRSRGWAGHDEIGRFSPEGHAKAELTYEKGNQQFEYRGITDLQGNLLVVFSNNSEAEGPVEMYVIDDPEPRVLPQPGPGPGDPVKPGDPEPEPEDPPYLVQVGVLKRIKEKPEGPKDVKAATYDFCVNVVPEGKMKVTGAGKYKYGQIAKIGGTVPEGWMLSNVSIDNPTCIRYKDGGFEIKGDGCVTVTLTEKEDVKNGKGAFAGKMVHSYKTSKGTENVPVYLELSPDNSYKTPYGDNTGGVMVTMFNPAETYSEGNVAVRMFAVPMKVSGIMEKDGRKWLVADGGTAIMGEKAILPGGNMDGTGAGLANLLMMFEGDNFRVEPGHYRIEILNEDPNTGAFTFGITEKFSPKYGWLPGGDKRLLKKRGTLMVILDMGLKADWLQGVRMTPADKRNDVAWYPTAEFFNGDKTRLEKAVSDLGKQYREFATEYDILKDANLFDLTKAIDTLMKGK